MHRSLSPSAFEEGQIWAGLGGGCVANSSSQLKNNGAQKLTFAGMKFKKQLKQRIIAWMLTSVHAMFWLSWSLHHFFSPEHQHETKVCRHAPNEKHFHGEEYAAVDCSICQIAPTLADLPDLQIPAFSFPKRIPAKKIFGETTCLSVSLFTIFQPRAPPAPLS